MLRTRAPLTYPLRNKPVRLACIRPAASVHPEPGSNSPLYTRLTTQLILRKCVVTDSLLSDSLLSDASRSTRRLGLGGVATRAQSTCKQHLCLSGSFGLDLC